MLEAGRSIAQAKGHYQVFEVAEYGIEGSLPLISLIDSNQVVGPPQIYFGEHGCRPLEQLRYKGKRIMFFYFLGSLHMDVEHDLSSAQRIFLPLLEK